MSNKTKFGVIIFQVVLSAVLLVGCISARNFISHEKQINLIGNVSTGYSWYVINSDESVIKVDEEIINLAGEEIAGAPSNFLYTIYSVQPGNAVIQFEYKRPWEDGIADFCEFEVTVNETGKIKIRER